MNISLNKLIALIKKIGGGQGAGGGVRPDWNQNDPTAADYVKNRPYYRSTERVHANDIAPYYSFPCTLTVEPMNGLYVAQATTLMGIAAPGVAYEVFLNGEQYICEGKESVAVSGAYVGADPSDDGTTFDFSKYPFVLLGNMLIVPNAGEYTLDVFSYETKTVRNYGAALKIEATVNDAGERCISANDLEEVKHAWNNDIPVYLNSVHNNLGISLIVTDVNDSFIHAIGASIDSPSKGVWSYVQMFYSEDGRLYKSVGAVNGTMYENGLSNPLLYIGTQWYKVTVDSDGTLKAEATT